nr:MAG: nonstructural protein [Microviridae sp.]
MKVFTIYDSKVVSYFKPFYEATAASAIRAVTLALKDESCAFAQCPSDYTLFVLGDYDESSGLFSLLSTPTSLGVLSEFVSG